MIKLPIKAALHVWVHSVDPPNGWAYLEKITITSTVYPCPARFLGQSDFGDRWADPGRTEKWLLFADSHLLHLLLQAVASAPQNTSKHIKCLKSLKRQATLEVLGNSP